MKTKLLLSLTALLISICPSAAEPLKARIQHSQKVAPVAPQLRAGSQFNRRNLPKEYSHSKWFKIPRWMAGEWRRRKVFIRENGRLVRSQNDVRQHRYGFQTDRAGNVWHWVRTPHPTITEQDDTISYFLIRDERLVDSRKNQVSIQIIWTTWVINKNTRVIEKVVQGVQLDTYKPKGDGALWAESHVANYNQDGKLLIRQNWCWQDDLMVYYEPQDNFEGADVKLLFHDYLRRQNLGQLRP